MTVSDEAGSRTDESAPTRRKRHPVRASVIALLALGLAAAGGVAATGAIGGSGDGGTADAAPTGPPKTVKVQRTTLTRTETVDGGLGYGESSVVQAPGGPAAAGVLTWLPAEGSVIRRGEPVYRLDERPVPLLYGGTPLYRALAPGAEGRDVTMLEKNLSALGYTGFTADDTYTGSTADAVRDWQEDLGRPQSGTVAAGDAVVATGERRVAGVTGVRGSAPAGEILSWTGSERLVSVDLDVAYEDLVAEGTKATVELPNGTSVAAEVAEVGTAATAAPATGGGSPSGSSGSSGGGQDATIPVTLTVGDQKKLGRYQAAPVEVTVEAETRKDVLAVPVNALVALREGGYALETVGTTGIEYRPVELGLFAGGMVEVSGADITDGLVVGVPK